jgi:hypothetical protein
VSTITSRSHHIIDDENVLRLVHHHSDHSRLAPPGELTTALPVDCEPAEGALSVMYITKPAATRFFTRMFLEGEKQREHGPRDSIHKMPR